MTAYVARLVERDGSEAAIETINLTGGPVFLNKWTPAASEATLAEFVDATKDGGETVENTLRSVVESIPITVMDGTYGGTAYVAHTVIDSINAMLARGTAYAKARRTDRRVWLEVQRESGTALYRSQVVAYRPVTLTGDSFGIDYAAGGAQALIVLTRRYYVEGAETELPLNGRQTGGVTIYNHADYVCASTAAAAMSAGGSYTYTKAAGAGICPGLVVVHATFGGTALTWTDNGKGAFAGTHVVTGSVNYLTGAISIQFDAAPDSGATVDYRTGGYGQHINYVDISGGDVVGSLPAPIKLRAEYTSGVSRNLGVLYAYEALSDPFVQHSVLEGEDSDGSDSAAATCSGGYYSTVTAAASPGYSTIGWTLASGWLNYMDGKWFKVFARLHTALIYNLNILPYFVISAATYKTFAQVIAGSTAMLNLVDLGAWQIPSHTDGALDLTLQLSSAVGSQAFNVDCLFWMPLDQYACYLCNFVREQYVFDNDGDVYYESAGGDRLMGITRLGNGLMVWPGVSQRIHFLMVDAAFYSPIGDTLGVKMWYRPRRAGF